jgi:hypothetical protein
MHENRNENEGSIYETLVFYICGENVILHFFWTKMWNYW